MSKICPFSRWQCDQKKSTASVLAMSYITALAIPYLNTVWATFSSAFIMSFIEWPDATNPKLSTNHKDIILATTSTT